MNLSSFFFWIAKSSFDGFLIVIGFLCLSIVTITVTNKIKTTNTRSKQADVLGVISFLIT